MKILYTSILQCQHIAYASSGLQLLVILCNQEWIQLDNGILRWVCLTHHYISNIILWYPNCLYIAWTKWSRTHWLQNRLNRKFWTSIWTDVFLLNCRLNPAQGSRGVSWQNSDAFIVWHPHLSACNYRMKKHLKKAGYYGCVLFIKCPFSYHLVIWIVTCSLSFSLAFVVLNATSPTF